MRIPVMPLLIMVLISLLIDLYIYLAARKRCRSALPGKIQLWSAIGLYALLAVTVCLPFRSGGEAVLKSVMWILFSFFSILITKAVFVIVDLLASIPGLFGHKRIKRLSVAGGALAVVVFLLIWWGALVNRFRSKVNEVDVYVENLPEKFDGYRIVQISDLHVGTFGSDTTFVSRLVDRINSENADLIVFTGDIVNRRTSELIPHIALLSRLDAADGVISIFGNHDYGDYSEWPSEKAKSDNLDNLKKLQREMGWDLLLNENRTIYREGDSISVIGVENVGDPPFTIYGSLPDSYENLSDSVTKILLTHNPVHWSMEIADKKDANVALTLSGHTHAMQIELFGLSPAAFRYKEWGGLYSDTSDKHYLYVNIGAGTVGFPMRIGATPEITVITLKKPD